MKKIFFVTVMVLSGINLCCFSQDPIVLTVNQAPPLRADAGTDVQIAKGGAIIIGGNPSAIGGYLHYLYSWTPAIGLNDPTLANPTASPMTTTTYRVTITDAYNCSAADEVIVKVDASGIDYPSSNLKFQCYPNPVEDELVISITGTPTALTIRLIDLVGKELILKKSYMTGTSAIERLSMHYIPAGVYVVQLLTPEEIFIQRIIKTLLP